MGEVHNRKRKKWAKGKMAAGNCIKGNKTLKTMQFQWL